MRYLGCHLSASNGNLAMVETAESIGANTLLSSPGIPGALRQRRKTRQTAPLPLQL